MLGEDDFIAPFQIVSCVNNTGVVVIHCLEEYKQCLRSGVTKEEFVETRAGMNNKNLTEIGSRSSADDLNMVQGTVSGRVSIGCDPLRSSPVTLIKDCSVSPPM
jgi:hypothetical protein